MMSRVLGVGFALTLLAIAAGCGGNHEVVEKELNELRAEVSRLRAQQGAMSERMDSMDADRAKAAPSVLRAPSAAPPPGAPPVVAARDGERPQLDIVKLAPSEGDGDVDNDPNRPIVRAVGDAGGRPTLNNRSIATHPKKGVTIVPQKKTDGDARPPAKPSP